MRPVVVGGDDQVPQIGGAGVPARRDLQPGIAPFAHHGQRTIERGYLQHADIFLPVDAAHRHLAGGVEHIVRYLDLARIGRRLRRGALRRRFCRGVDGQGDLQLRNGPPGRLLRAVLIIQVISRQEKGRCDQQQPKTDR